MKTILLFALLAAPLLLAGWKDVFIVVDGHRYALLVDVEKADCDRLPALPNCALDLVSVGLPPTARYRAAVVVFRRIDNEPANERSGVADSTRTEVARFYADCQTSICKQDSPEKWVRLALSKETK